MCQAPCCGTPAEINALIEAGYGDRLMLDDWPGDEDMMKPALKGHERQKAPWATKTEEGCTFWKEGKCELHDTGLKPMHARLAHHDNTDDDWRDICAELKKTWQGEEAEICITNWREKYYKGDRFYYDSDEDLPYELFWKSQLEGSDLS
jgi:hypothetical protein